jgi:hypothetical protein
MTPRSADTGKDPATPATAYDGKPHGVGAVGYSEIAHERTAVRVPGPPSRQPRPTARCPRGRAGTPGVQAVDARGRRCQKRQKMTDRQLSATDAAVRARIKELSVHIPCGRLRGPVPLACKWHELHRCWQSCPDEDSPETWVGWDVSRAFDLCIICVRATAGGPSRWSWLACDDCTAVNSLLESKWGFRPFALGRHSLMNNIGVRLGASPEVRAQQMARLTEFAKSVGSLRRWHRGEYLRLASRFDPLADVPLHVWHQQWAPGRDASWDAFSRLTKC